MDVWLIGHIVCVKSSVQNGHSVYILDAESGPKSNKRERIVRSLNMSVVVDPLGVRGHCLNRQPEPCQHNYLVSVLSYYTYALN